MTSVKDALHIERVDSAPVFRALSRWTAFSVFCLSAPCVADSVEIVHAEAQCRDRTCRFDVTLKHADSGWEHYADQWQIFDTDGNLLGTRTLFHPHVDEQPFTRSLAGVEIPANVSAVVIKARDSVHGVSQQNYILELDSQ